MVPHQTQKYISFNVPVHVKVPASQFFSSAGARDRVIAVANLGDSVRTKQVVGCTNGGA